MSVTNSEEIVLQIRHQFEGLLQLVGNTQLDNTLTAYEVELTLFRRLLELGKRLLLLFFVSQANAQHPPKITTPEGESLPYHSQKRKSYLSIFGKLSFHRSYYYQQKKGYFPLDARLNLPPKGGSDLLKEWREQIAVYAPFHKVYSFQKLFILSPFSPFVSCSLISATCFSPHQLMRAVNNHCRNQFVIGNNKYTVFGNK